jgi:hypothetical protein
MEIHLTNQLLSQLYSLKKVILIVSNQLDLDLDLIVIN